MSNSSNQQQTPFQRLKQRFEKAVRLRQPHERLFNTAFKFTMPGRRFIGTSNTNLNRDKSLDAVDQLDLTGVEGINRYVNILYNSFLSGTWFRVQALTEEERQARGGLLEARQNELLAPLSAEQLSALNLVIMEELNKGTFATAAYESLKDMSVTAGCMKVIAADRGNARVHFESVPINEVFLEREVLGRVEAVFRNFNMTGAQIVSNFIGINLDSLNLDECTNYRLLESDVYDARRGTYTYQIHLYEREIRLFENVSPVRTLIAFRGDKCSGETWGSGIFAQLANTLMLLNKAAHITLYAADLDAEGVYITNEDEAQRLAHKRIEPGDVLGVRDPGEFIKLPPSNITILERLQIPELRARIDGLLLNGRFGSPSSPQRTATEVIQMETQLIQQMSGSLGRIQFEMLEEIARTTTYVVSSQLPGLTPNPIIVNGERYKFLYLNQIEQQRNTNKLQPLITALQVLGGIDPMIVQQTMRVGNLGPYIAQALGVDSEVLNTPEEIEQYLAGAAQQQAAELQMQLAMNGQNGALPTAPATPTGGIEDGI